MAKAQREAPLPVTPDGRYLVVKGRLWRCTNPALPDAERSAFVSQLMEARRAIGRAQRAKDGATLAAARARVDEAKVGLGERGPVWWSDGAPDFNRGMVKNSPYLAWHENIRTSGD
jgi:hypothetical protein